MVPFVVKDEPLTVHDEEHINDYEDMVRVPECIEACHPVKWSWKLH
jgi:hypothetical protein